MTKKSRYIEQQNIALFREVELDAKINDTYRKFGIIEVTYYKWKSA